MFLRNAWYVAAWSSEITRAMTPRIFLGEMVVMYRTEAGQVVALADRCPHRNLPLSKGVLVGPDRVRCGYHGIEFNGAGNCVYDPDSKKALPWANVRCYPTDERNGWVFIWMGDPKLADRGKVPTHHEKLTTQGWDVVSGHELAKGNHHLPVDNLFTLSHLAYVHPKTIANEDFAYRVEYTADPLLETATGPGVRLKHIVRDAPCPPAYPHFGAKIDRWTVIDFLPPGYVHIRFGTTPAGQVDLHADMSAAMTSHDNWVVYHAITPETETTCHDFWAHLNPSGLYAGKSKSDFEQTLRDAIAEDMQVYAAQQACILADADNTTGDVRAKVALREDQAMLQIRRLMERLIREEQAKTRKASNDISPSADAIGV
jgi:phenylpropionate dioxygenase-like ring-hydroxylating dioxygenase large terminal subunit